MNVCAKFTSDKTDDVTSDLPKRPLEGESYWIFVWTLGGGRHCWKGSRTRFLYGLWEVGVPVGRGVVLDFCMDFGVGAHVGRGVVLGFCMDFGRGRPLERESY